MIAIIQHFVPDINFELEGLKAIGAKLGIAAPAPPVLGQAPRRSLPPSMEAAYLQGSDSTPAQSEATSKRSQSPDPSEFEEDEEEVVTTVDLLTIVDPKLDEEPSAQEPVSLENRNTKHPSHLDI